MESKMPSKNCVLFCQLNYPNIYL